MVSLSHETTVNCTYIFGHQNIVVSEIDIVMLGLLNISHPSVSLIGLFYFF